MTQASIKIKYIYDLEPARLIFSNVNDGLEQVFGSHLSPMPFGDQVHKLN